MGARWISCTMAMAVVLAAGAAGCTPTSPTPPTRLAITTDLTICGGAYHDPPCTTNPTSAAVTVNRNGTVVASATTPAGGTVVLSVPAGSLTVARTSPPGGQQCDRPTVTAVAGATTPVTQTCVLDAP